MKAVLWFVALALLASCSPSQDKDEEEKFGPSPGGKGYSKEASQKN